MQEMELIVLDFTVVSLRGRKVLFYLVRIERWYCHAQRVRESDITLDLNPQQSFHNAVQSRSSCMLS